MKKTTKEVQIQEIPCKYCGKKFTVLPIGARVADKVEGFMQLIVFQCSCDNTLGMNANELKPHVLEFITQK